MSSDFMEVDSSLLVLESPEEAISQIGDEELARLSRLLVDSANKVTQQLTVLPRSDRDPDKKDQLVRQDIIDSTLVEIVGEEEFSRAYELSAIFGDLQRKRGNSEYPKESFLYEGVMSLAIGILRSRSALRSAHGTITQRTKRIVNYIRGDDEVLDSSQLSIVTSKITDPSYKLSEERLSIINSGQDLTIEQLDKLLGLADKVDPSTSLVTAKLIIFASIARVFDRPEIRNALDNTYRGTSESVDHVQDSEYADIYHAVELLDSLEEDSDDWQIRMELMLNSGSSSIRQRVGIGPGRKFRDEYNLLYQLATVYRKLWAVSNDIEQTRSAKAWLENERKAVQQQTANSLVSQAIDILNGNLNSVSDWHNLAVMSAQGIPEKSDELWQRAIRADRIRHALAAGILRTLESSGQMDIDPSLKKALLDQDSNIFEGLFESYKTEELLRQLGPEIDARLAEFNSIDGKYTISNKKLRERNPDLISLAKLLSDSLSEHEPIDDSTSRLLVGLMLGVYWERTGKDASNSQLIQEYLVDIHRLRQLGSELEYFGQRHESRLLKHINLLDELIDSGLFDDFENHPELAVFEDFIIEYIIARDSSSSEQSASDNAENEEVGFSEVPVETIRQARQEDLLVFPPNTSLRDILEDFKSNITEKDLPLIEWERITKLVELRDHCLQQGLQVEFIRTKHASWQVLPFFILEVKLPNDDHAVAIVESPVYGNATYIFRESSERPTWREVVQLTRQEAREFGAVPAVHVDSSQLNKHFKKVWDRLISELTVFR